MADQFGITYRAAYLDGSVARPADGAGPQPAHRYGRVAIEFADPTTTRGLIVDDSVPTDLTEVERLGLEASRQRESPEYLAAKANRPRIGQTWDMPSCIAARELTAPSADAASASPGNGYLEGPVAVGIVIVQGPTPDLAFSDAEIGNVVTQVQNGLSFYLARNPLAGISFSYDIQNVTLELPVDPTLAPKDMEAYWRDPAMQAIGYGTGGPAIDAYVNALRQNADTRWSYIAYFTKYPVQWFAYVPAINGGYVVMSYFNDGWGPDNIDTVFAHESGHIFGAADEYAGQPSCTAQWTSQRFGIHNPNCEVVAADGGIDCIMKTNDFVMCDYTPAHLGWEANLMIHNFAAQVGSWRVQNHLRMVTDLNNDGRADVVGFGDDGIWVSRATGSGRFEAARLVAEEFAYNQGWRVDKHPRFLADVSGTHLPAIVGFGDDGVWFSAAKGDGTFGAASFVIADLGYNQGWRLGTHARMMADLSGRGAADIVACGDAGVWTAMSTGSGFDPVAFVLPDFGTDSGWQAARHPRLCGDITGNGRADLVGFGDAGVYTAMSNGDGSFAGAKFVLADLGYNQGWRVENHLRFVVNLGGRPTADIVGFGAAGVYVARADGDGSFTAPVLAVNDFGYDQGWRIDEHPRFLADTTGDGRLDIVGCGAAGIYISRQLADGTFEVPYLAMTNFGYDAGGWRVDLHPRFLADVDGNGRADMVGFGNAGVWIARF